MAFVGITALVAGEAVTTAVVLSAIAEIGTVMTVVGGITGSKELMQIGGAMALVGGIGGMVNGALSGAAVAGEGIDAASQVASEAYGGAAGAEAAQQAGIDSMTSGATDAATTGMDAASGMTDLSAGPSMDSGPAPGPNIAQQEATAVPDQLTASDTGATQQAPIIQGAQTPQGPIGAATPNAPITPYENPTDMRLAGSTQTAPQGSGSFWNSFTDFANKNKTLLGAGMQLGSGLLKGMNDRQMWDQKMALEQQKVNQTSFGNTVGSQTPVSARPGIIAGARA